MLEQQQQNFSMCSVERLHSEIIKFNENFNFVMEIIMDQC